MYQESRDGVHRRGDFRLTHLTLRFYTILEEDCLLSYAKPHEVSVVRHFDLEGKAVRSHVKPVEGGQQLPPITPKPSCNISDLESEQSTRYLVRGTTQPSPNFPGLCMTRRRG